MTDNPSDRAPGSPASGPPPDRQRRLTVLFVDLVGSTPLAEQLEPEQYRDLVSAYYEIVDDVVQRFDGLVARRVGDGVLACFGYPRAHEDDATRATLAGLELVGRVGPVLGRLLGPGAPAVELRAAAHSGPVVTARIAGGLELVGTTVNEAARLEAIAPPGSLAISETTRQLLDGSIETEEHGTFELKGVSAPTLVHRVLRRRRDTAWTEPPTPLVDRESERNRLVTMWQEVRAGATDRPTAIVLQAEPGLGKTRLAQLLGEISSRVGQDPLVATARPFDVTVPYHPLAAMLLRAMAVDERAGADRVWDEVRRLVDDAGTDPPVAADLAVALDLPAGLTGAHDIDPATVAHRTAEAFMAWWTARAAAGPYVLVLEDHHWADPSTVALVDALLARPPMPGVMTVITTRPSAVDWGARDGVELFELQPLSVEARARLCRLHGGDLGLTDHELERVAELSDGVPLYIERLLDTVRDRGELTGTDVVPGDLEGLLTATLSDDLDHHLLGLLAAIGREFDAPLVADILEEPAADVTGRLDELARRGILDRLSGPGTVTYAFHHALIRNAVYDQQLPSERRRAHRAVADALERGADPSRLASAALASHYDLGNRPTRALPHYLDAIDSTQRRGAHSEALQLLDRTLDLIASLDDGPSRDRSELRALLRLALSVTSTAGYGAERAATALRRAHELAGRIGEVALHVQVLGDLLSFHAVRGDRGTAWATLEEMRELSAGSGVDIQADLMMFEGLLLFARGHIAAAEDNYRTALAQVDRHDTPERAGHLSIPSDPLASVCAMMIPITWLDGRHGEALEWIDRGLGRCQELASAKGAFSEGFIRSWITWMHAVAGDHPRALDAAAEMVDIATRQGMAMWAGLGELHRTIAAAHLEAGAGHTEVLAVLIDAMAAMGVTAIAPYFMTQHAAVLAIEGELDAAIARCDAAMTLAEEKDEVFYQPESLRLRAGLRQRCGEPDESVADDLRRAARLAATQRSPVFEARALLDLAATVTGSADGRAGLARMAPWLDAVAGDYRELVPAAALARDLDVTAP